jgi:hypothetical protein
MYRWLRDMFKTPADLFLTSPPPPPRKSAPDEMTLYMMQKANPVLMRNPITGLRPCKVGRKDLYQTGRFHCWATMKDDLNHILTRALVELDSGKIIDCDPARVIFTDREEDKPNGETVGQSAD